MEYRLGDIAEYSSRKIKTIHINKERYVSTENMLPNKKGI